MNNEIEKIEGAKKIWKEKIVKPKAEKFKVNKIE